MKIPKLYILILLALAGCKGSILIERGENFGQNKAGNMKIICIDPRFYYEEDERNYNNTDLENLNNSLKKDIINFAKKNKLQLELLDLNEKSDPAYYALLLKLKQNILAANNNQYTPLNFNTKTVGNNEISKKVFVYPPKISYDFSQLSKIYGTPYFSYIGIYELKKGSTMLYHVIVDTDKAETIYREYKYVDKGLQKNFIGQMVYDSFAMLKKEMENN